MSIEWAATIDARSLREYFGDAIVARGIQCRHDEHVEAANWDGRTSALVAQCRGSAHERYVCTIDFERVGVDWEVAWVECTCPVTQWCKHGVASLLTFAAYAQDPDPVADWESSSSRRCAPISTPKGDTSRWRWWRSTRNPAHPTRMGPR